MRGGQDGDEEERERPRQTESQLSEERLEKKPDRQTEGEIICW